MSDKVPVKVRLVGGSIDGDSGNITLSCADPSGSATDIEFSPDDGEALLAAIASGLGQIARQRTGDSNLKKVFPVEWWEIAPLPNGIGFVLAFRMPGGMEMAFQLDNDAAARYAESLSTLVGIRQISTPERKN